MKAVLLISHGSRFPETEEEIRAFTRQLKEKSAVPIVEYAFLDIAHPSIPEGIDTCVTQGATEIIRRICLARSLQTTSGSEPAQPFLWPAEGMYRGRCGQRGNGP